MASRVVVVGASFAGLSVARQLGPEALLLDPKLIGSQRTSACCTFLYLLEEMGCADAVLQVFDTVYVHTPGGRSRFRLHLPLATFDYQKLCLMLFRQTGSHLRQLSAVGLSEHGVVTTGGTIPAEILVDASGHRCVLGNSVGGEHNRRDGISFGLEATVPFEDPALHLFADRRIAPGGAAWIFPCGSESRFGVASYEGKTRLGRYLDAFLARYGLERRDVTGGFFPHRMPAPTSGSLFLVGDAAGICYPLTGEGIRAALHYGSLCGRLIVEVLEGHLGLEGARLCWRRQVLQHLRDYRMLLKAQEVLTYLPHAALWILGIVLRLESVEKSLVGLFERLLSPDLTVQPHRTWVYPINPSHMTDRWEPNGTSSSRSFARR